MSDTQVISRRVGKVGHISLNRPRALHSLNLAMCEAISAALLEWRDEPAVEAIILDHAEGTRGFCAGGDVVAVRKSALEDDGAAGRAFFRAEYRMNHLLFTFPKPLVAFMDGVTMGGGGGLAMPARCRVASENTRFAMPEGAIGLFPDVGAGWYLPRLPRDRISQIGKFLALTGAVLDGAEASWTGIATHYLPAARLAEAKARIAAAPRDIVSVLAALSANPPPPRLMRNAAMIDRLFAPDSLEDIIAALADDPSEWAAKELRAISARCPVSAKVALRQFALAATQPDFAAEMALEYRLACRMMLRPDFSEGVRAVLVDKDRAPRWDPPAPEQVTKATLDAIFTPLDDSEEWTPFAPREAIEG